MASETDATSRTTSYTYDAAGRLASTELPSGATTTYAYDADGRLVTETSPEGRVTTTTYDDAGQVLTVDDPRSGLSTSTYTPRGDLLTRTDATGGTITWGHDEAGRVTSVTDPLGRETTYGYDSRGNRVLRVDALDGEREWHHDLADRLTTEIDPLDRETTYGYDALGRLDVRTDGAGRTETYGYDAAGQVTSLTYASGTPTTFQYDEEGRRTRMVDASGTTIWFYNATGQMTGADNPGDRDLAWAWDLAGRRTVVTYPDDTEYRNRYDTDGNLSEVERNDSGTWVDVAVNSYDDDGNLLVQDQPGGLERTWALDAVTGLPTSHIEDDGSTTRTTTLTHDAAGRVATQAVGGVTTTYGYDAAGQLLTVDRSTGTDDSYVYDELGRRSTSTVGGVTTTYLWDAASQMTRRAVGGNNHNYQYDTSGRRTREAWNGGTDVLQWFWGPRGNFTGQRSTAPGSVTDIARSTRGDGRLASSTTSVGGVPVDTTDVIWDDTLAVPQPIWTGQRGQANETLAVYGPDLIRVDCPTGTNCTGPVAHDVHGSALETTGTQSITQAPSYDPWGLNGGSLTVGTEYGYRSELHTGTLVHLRARDYDPASGTFLSPDPLDGVDGTTTVNNPYHYTNNDPINHTDPTGLRPSDFDMGPNGARAQEKRFPIPRAPHIGTIWANSFISAKEVGGNFNPSLGDGRGFSSSAGCSQSRVCVRLNFTAGMGMVGINYSCATNGHCTDAWDINGNVNRVEVNAGSDHVNVDIRAKHADAGWQESINTLDVDMSLSVDLSTDYVEPFPTDLGPPSSLDHLARQNSMPVQRPLVSGRYERFPSIEVYHRVGGRTSTLLKEKERSAFLGIPTGLASNDQKFTVWL